MNIARSKGGEVAYRNAWWMVVCASFGCGPSAELEEARAAAGAAQQQLQRAVQNDETVRRQAAESLEAATQAREEARTEKEGLQATHRSLWERFDLASGSVELYAEPAAEAEGLVLMGKCRRSPSDPLTCGILYERFSSLVPSAPDQLSLPGRLKREAAVCCARVLFNDAMVQARALRARQPIAEILAARAALSEANAAVAEAEQAVTTAETQGASAISAARQQHEQLYAACLALEQEEDERGGCGDAPESAAAGSESESEGQTGNGGTDEELGDTTDEVDAEGEGEEEQREEPIGDEEEESEGGSEGRPTGEVTGRLIQPRATLAYSLDRGGPVLERFEWSVPDGPEIEVGVRDPADTEDGRIKVVALWPGRSRPGILMSFPQSAADATVHFAALDSGQLLIRYEAPPHSQFEGEVTVRLVEWWEAEGRPETSATWTGSSEEYHRGRAPEWTRMFRMAGE